MSEPLRVLLIEDEQDICQRFKTIIEEKDDIVLIGITNNSYRALEFIETSSPDAIILDLELHYGIGNGLLLLDEMRNHPLNDIPYVLVTTNNPSPTTHQYARQTGADFIMCKHQDGYSEEKAVEFLCMMSSIIRSSQKEFSPMYTITETPKQKKQRYRRIILRELDFVGISRKSVGYQYLIDAILTVTDDPSITNIASIVATHFNKSPASIERGIQNAINRAWNTMDIEQLLSHYTARVRSTKGVPTLNEFVYFYANKILAEF